MIERTHFRAMQIATRNAEQAAVEGNAETVLYSAKQTAAIAALELQRKKIFAEYGVHDVEEDSLPADEFERIRQMSLGDTLAYYRNSIGMSQSELAELVGTVQVSVSRHETGEVIPSAYTLRNYMSGFRWKEDDPRVGLIFDKAAEERQKIKNSSKQQK